MSLPYRYYTGSRSLIHIRQMEFNQCLWMEDLPFGCQETKFLPLGRPEQREFSPAGIPHFNQTVNQTYQLILPEESHAGRLSVFHLSNVL